MLTREELRGALRERLYSCPDVLAMWEAGSAAFDRADERSDLDIGVLARGDALPSIWRSVEHALDDVGGFSIRWENPLHVFKGMTQRVYRPARGGRWLDLDIGVFEETAEDLYLQPQRHGRADVLFDRSDGRRTATAQFDEVAHRRRMREALHQEIMRWNLYRDFVAKELARGRTIDAFGFYIAFAVRPVLTVLGMLHRPDRFDYGFRYVKDELPADDVAAIERLCYVGNPGELPARVEDANRLFVGAVEELNRRGIQPVDAKGTDVLKAD
jgi:predicted nucleotidyltransferase